MGKRGEEKEGREREEKEYRLAAPVLCYTARSIQYCKCSLVTRRETQLANLVTQALHTTVKSHSHY